jgi:hypothetical protein
MKKLMILLLTVVFMYTIQNAYSMPNPWIDCGDDLSCAANKAGFNFPLRVKNYSARAMEGMFEIKFNYTKRKAVTIRKAQIFDGEPDKHGIIDVSGDYNKYPINKGVKLKNGVWFSVRGDKNKFYVANFAAETGYYSIMCDKGIKLKDLNYFYKLLEEAEAPRFNFDETDNYTIEQLQDMRRVDGIVEPVFTQDCFPRTLQKKGVTTDCFERANLGQDSHCTASEIKMIKDYYKKGQAKDFLNNGNGNFCAKE